MAKDIETPLKAFLAEVRPELRRAVAKFPAPNPTLAALTEELGELAEALLHIREGKSNDWWRVWEEAVQVAAMAARVAIEGDPTLGAVPTTGNCRDPEAAAAEPERA